MDKPDLLIEQWLPTKELGIESVRERAVYSDLPPIYALHVWWARRPLSRVSGGHPRQSPAGLDSGTRRTVLRRIPNSSREKAYHELVPSPLSGSSVIRCRADG